MGPLWLIVVNLLWSAGAYGLQKLQVADRSTWILFRFLVNPETPWYLLIVVRPICLTILVHSTLPWHILPTINSGILYYLWALLRAATFLLLLLSTCTFASDHLSSLPAELLQQIFLNSHADLHALCKVSKLFHAIAEPLLYKHIRLIKEPRRGHSHPVLLLMRSIEYRQDLVKLIKTLELSSYHMVFEAGEQRSALAIKAGREEADIATSCANYVLWMPFLTARLAWSQELKAGALDAFVHLLLVWLPNLTSVTLQGYTWNKANLLTLIIQRVPMQAMFLDLMHLDLRSKVDVHERRATKLTLQQFAQVLRIPSLRHLAVDMIESETALWPLIDVDPSNMSALTSLDVTVLHEENLDRILYLLPQLQKLQWIFWLNYKRPRPPNHMICSNLRSSLSRCLNTLQELRIIPEHGFGRQWRISKVVLQGTLDLSAFTSLRSLEIPFQMLVGKQEEDRVVLAEVLPRGLEHLILVDCPKCRHSGGRWNTISLLNVLRPFLVNIIHGTDEWKLKTLTSRLYVDPESEAGVLARGERSAWKKKLHTELEYVCDLVGVGFIGD